MTPSRLIKVGEAADRLSLTPDAVYKLIRAGKLPVVRLSESRLRVDEGVLEHFIKSGGVPADKGA